MSAKQPVVTHEATTCERSHHPTALMYCGKSWKALFRCPKCGRECWQNLNFLGGRKVVCNGRKFAKVA